MLHLNKMINLDTGALQTKTTGEKIVCKLQEYLLSKMSPDKCAVLPEDKIQRLLVGYVTFCIVYSSNMLKKNYYINLLLPFFIL